MHKFSGINDLFAKKFFNTTNRRGKDWRKAERFKVYQRQNAAGKENES
jgi:hypothetical protein